ncbi:polysaccharide export protein [Vandammella animalimorsus]|uniref:Polysaccharide export protein n=1 Tax=Vandammella animalimorsus TaxID=2029117 RepID=A0A3M6R8V4_9BURK|nr:polysaccharide biosynthesis/export family protein [Vandammella animalimorsus]RMX11138.1 polysaccharide export protein [Vandammella animalimorsus]
MRRTSLAAALALLLAGCASSPGWLPASGPNMAQIVAAQRDDSAAPPVAVHDVDEALTRRLLAAQRLDAFAHALPAAQAPEYLVGAGDTVEVSIWEAPPAALFGGTTLNAHTGSSAVRATFPEQIVNRAGIINVPFAGAIEVAGKTPQAIEAELVQRLRRKANQPQVLVRVLRNATSNVTVIGEVGASQRVPLTARGERLLDALAAAGGVRQPVGKITLQLSRAGQVLRMPLTRVIEEPEHNVLLQPGDVLTALHRPLSLTVLGATGRNEEIDFEAQGISLAQALARAGGIQDARGDARAVFVFRFERPQVLQPEPSPEQRADAQPPAARTANGLVPVIYRMDFRDPRAFLLAQSFPMQDKDVLYVANAPAAELQKFLNILSSTLFSVRSLSNL